MVTDYITLSIATGRLPAGRKLSNIIPIPYKESKGVVIIDVDGLTCVCNSWHEIQPSHVRDDKGRQVNGVGTGGRLWCCSMIGGEVDASSIRGSAREGKGGGDGGQ